MMRTEQLSIDKSLCWLVLVLSMSACGNKGDLFLPIDDKLANELDAATGLIDESAQGTEASDDDINTEPKPDELEIKKRQSKTGNETGSQDSTDSQ